METTNSAIILDETHIGSNKKPLSSTGKETEENLIDHHDEPSYFFRGAVFGFFLCVPFWAVIFWFIT